MSDAALFQSKLAVFAPLHQQLRDKPEETAEGSLRALWFAASGAPRAIEHLADLPLPDLNAAQRSEFDKLVEMRLSGVPLAHLTGRQLFMGLEFWVSKAALVPRKETEIVGRAALERILAACNRNASAVVIDVCTGSGNLALAFAWHAPQCRVYACDLSADAVALAKQNAEQLGLSERIEFRVGDLLSPFDSPEFHGKVDVLSCNPPYISTGKLPNMPREIIGFEPELAFNGGPFGINIINKVIQQSAKFLTPGGWFCMEVGEGQGNGVLQLLSKNRAFEASEAFHDVHGNIRAVAARSVGLGQPA